MEEEKAAHESKCNVGDLKKKIFSSFLTDRKLKEISPEATAFHFGTIKPWRQDGLFERWQLPTGSLSPAETAGWYLKVR